MDSSIVDQFIQKKRLYKHQAILDRFEMEFYNHMFPSIDSPSNMTQQELIKEIEALELLNFKNRTMIISSYRDVSQNEQEILILNERLKQQKEEVKQLQLDLQKAEKVKENKIKYNKISKELVKYCKGENIDAKIEAVQQDIKQMETSIERKLRKFTNREKLFKKSIAGLRSYLEQFQQDNDDSEDKIAETGHDQEQ